MVPIGLAPDDWRYAPTATRAMIGTGGVDGRRPARIGIETGGDGTMMRTRREARPVDSRTVATAGVMLALVFVMTRLPQVPIGNAGYIHLGDAAIYVASFLFGPVVGAFAAAFGTTLVDLSTGYGSFAPGTFLIHGVQGLAAALLAWRRGVLPMLVAVVVGGVIVVAGYFVYQWLALGQGLGPAVQGLGLNTVQVAVGGALGILITIAVRRAYPPVTTFGQHSSWDEEPYGTSHTTGATR